MSIAPIGSMPNFSLAPGFASPYTIGMAGQLPTDGAQSVAGALAPGAVPGVNETTDVGGTFGNLLTTKLSELNQLHATSDELALRAVTGDLTDVHEYTIAANQAAVATQLAVAVRNKAVEAFTEIMRMQL